MSVNEDYKIYSFPPVSNENSRILILGTMPGPISIQTGEYYANPGNCFWEFISKLRSPYVTNDYASKIKMLKDNQIAIWDVLKHCERKSGLDSDIKAEYPNDFVKFFVEHKNLRAIFFNGTKAKGFYKRYIGFDNKYEYAVLPSTSPTPGKNVKSKEAKYVEWKKILNHIATY